MGDFTATGWLAPVCLFLCLYGLGSLLLDIGKLFNG